jgi:hypothetical protein
MTDPLTLDTFAACVEETFQVELEKGQSLELVLDSVDELKAPTPDYECFSLLFSGPKDIFMEQQTRRVTHARLGSFDLFLVPVDGDEEHYYYEMIFHRKKPAPGSE